MPLKDPNAEKLMSELVSSGLVPAADYERMVLMQKTQGKAWTVDEIAERFMDGADMYALRPSQIDDFRSLAIANGVAESKVSKEPEATLEDEPAKWYEPSSLGITPDEIGEEISMWGDALGNLDLWGRVEGAVNAAGQWVADELIDPGGAEARAAGEPGAGRATPMSRDQAKVINAQQREILRMVEMITGEQVDTVNWKEEGYGSLNDLLREKYDLSSAEMAEVMQSAFNVGVLSRNRNDERQEDIRLATEEEESLLSNDEKRSKKKLFEALNDQQPGRYVFNESNGQIYQVGVDGGLVGDDGELVAEDTNYLNTGELPEGVLAEDMYWSEAQAIESPWTQAGTDIDTYYSFVDVLDNPQRYHAGGVGRFASNEAFLGGFSPNYAVAQSPELQRQISEERKGPGQDRSALRRGMGEYAWESWTQDIAEVRRPWYDEGDNWALFAGRSPEAIAAEQQKLIDAGALDEGDVVKGSWGMAEAKVMQTMMTVANGKALRLEDIDMADWKNMWEETAGSAATRRAFVAPAYQRLDPARAQLTIEDAVRRQLGRNATDDELADLGIHMQDMHRQSFQADVQAMRAEYDATTRAIDTESAQAAGEVQGVDWEAQFQTQFNERNEAELARFDRTQDRAQRQQIIGGAMDGFMRTLGGGIGGGSLGGQ